MELNLKTSILKVLAYFDLFDYPLSKEEIYLFLDRKADGNDFRTGLAKLSNDGIIFRFNEFYLLRNEPALVKKRIKEKVG